MINDRLVAILLCKIFGTFDISLTHFKLKMCYTLQTCSQNVLINVCIYNRYFRVLHVPSQNQTYINRRTIEFVIELKRSIYVELWNLSYIISVRQSYWPVRTITCSIAKYRVLSISRATQRLSICRGKFHKSSQQISHGSPARASYGMPFVSTDCRVASNILLYCSAIYRESPCRLFRVVQTRLSSLESCKR